MRPNILVFAGAGASMAVNAEQFPTTFEFFKRLPDTITGFHLFQQIVAFIQSKTKSQRVDIEQVLWGLDELRRDLLGLDSGSSAVGYCLNQNNVAATVGRVNFGHLTQAVQTLLTHSDWLASEINKLVYDLYSYDPVEDELSTNWTSLIKPLWGLSGQFNIFTTNYDGVIESALVAGGFEGDDLNSFLGLAGARRKYVNLDAWKEAPANHKGLLTKLHGSVDWKRNGNRINVSDAGFAGDHERHPIIYPGFKGVASSEFFTVFHSYLESAVKEADILIFIGFAFRDDHINTVIRDALRDDALVAVIDPDPKVRFCSNRVDPLRIGSFDQDGLSDVYDFVGAYAAEKPRKARPRAI